MKQSIRVAAVVAGFLALPTLGSAAQATAGAAGAKTPAATRAAVQPKSMAKSGTAQAALHSAHGVVTAVDGSSLVITQKGGKAKAGHEMRFALEPSTQREGDVAVGSMVEVRYRNDAKMHVASDIKASSARKKS